MRLQRQDDREAEVEQSTGHYAGVNGHHNTHDEQRRHADHQEDPNHQSGGPYVVLVSDEAGYVSGATIAVTRANLLLEQPSILTRQTLESRH
jgi:hypothetical protein